MAIRPYLGRRSLSREQVPRAVIDTTYVFLNDIGHFKLIYNVIIAFATMLTPCQH